MIPSSTPPSRGHGACHRIEFRTLVLLAVALPLLLTLAAPLGTLSAVSGQEQKREEDSARDAREANSGTPIQGMETLTDLLEEQRISIEFVRSIEARLEDIRRRERELDQREKALALVQQDIERKLRRLEAAREKLESLTRQVDADREEELSQAVRKYKAMSPEMAAKVFNQMELEFVAPVLKRMDTQTGGKIMDAMVEEAETGEDSATKLRKLKELGEYMVDPQLVESKRDGMDPESASATAATP